MENTIAAISTPIGVGGISVIRISGSNAFLVAKSIFKSKIPFDSIKSHTVTYGKIQDKEGNTVDHVLLIKMKSPKTYTKEDIVEIHCHGGMYVTKKILALTYANGATPAQPGEFTKRAFMNGSIDLMEAEAVMDLINSEAEDSYKEAISQLKGEKSLQIKQIRNELIDLISHIMVVMDYPEYDVEKISAKEARNKAEEIKNSLKAFIEDFDNRRIIRKGLNVAVVGDVNVGKSTFINKACGQNRVIVTDIAGTTRDVVEVKIDIKGLCVTLKDTAGIRSTDNQIEKIGIEKSKEAIEEADAVIYIADISKPYKDDIFNYIKDMDKTICVLNKTDLLVEDERDKHVELMEKDLRKIFKDRIVACSLEKKEGINEIFDKLLEMVNAGEIRQKDTAITNERHKRHISDAIDFLDNTKDSSYIDMLSVDLTCAAEELGKITGETASADIVDRIFEKFCIGK
ncbi:MAG TPA: tRNA uridine-5-carboxymethylaminomethyl(34) synthesis GTPase MnmE [Clostridia bacterium]|jgi:tRNA modification GTPase|nr:MAG: tRNA modification GTPase MnmE [Firmicutes bacterium ADurb.Bin146]HOD93035.1 tRNA uridine-5-carboxymethylaminomethyl(34) synthesis GTPase MnmE [Clostridia bacterium]HQM39650.1 tRNA uridine-5-carboxymethylaminomethyl(34) synthesis GTPase MnmE [Clostridia bacterium]